MSTYHTGPESHRNPSAPPPGYQSLKDEKTAALSDSPRKLKTLRDLHPSQSIPRLTNTNFREIPVGRYAQGLLLAGVVGGVGQYLLTQGGTAGVIAIAAAAAISAIALIEALMTASAAKKLTLENQEALDQHTYADEAAQRPSLIDREHKLTGLSYASVCQLVGLAGVLGSISLGITALEAGGASVGLTLGLAIVSSLLIMIGTKMDMVYQQQVNDAFIKTAPPPAQVKTPRQNATKEPWLSTTKTDKNSIAMMIGGTLTVAGLAWGASKTHSDVVIKLGIGTTGLLLFAAFMIAHNALSTMKHNEANMTHLPAEKRVNLYAKGRFFGRPTTVATIGFVGLSGGAALAMHALYHPQAATTGGVIGLLLASAACVVMGANLERLRQNQIEGYISETRSQSATPTS